MSYISMTYRDKDTGTFWHRTCSLVARSTRDRQVMRNDREFRSLVGVPILSLASESSLLRPLSL
jgi:hypothetical protein